MPYSYITLCAGGGIGTVGLDDRGWKCLAAVEILPDRRRLLKAKHPHATILSDVFEVRASELPPAHLWVATAPCQELSEANTRGKGITDVHPWHGCIRLLRQSVALGTAPKLLLMEQVPTLLEREQYRESWEVVRSSVSESGYDLVDLGIIDARAIIPTQRRERLFVLWERAR